MDEQPADLNAAPRQDETGGRTTIRCLLALICSHAAAPYAAARITIRYFLDGNVEPKYAIMATAAIGVGAMLSFRQLVTQPVARRTLYALALIILWFGMILVQLTIAVDSVIPRPLLTLLWGCGTLWVAWTVWAWCFFRGKAILVGSTVVGLGAVVFWSLVDITGLTGDAAVEFAWRKHGNEVVPENALPSGVVHDPGEIRWPGYLGSSRDGTVGGVTLNEDWEAHPPRELWRNECGPGWSSFVATETTLFTQEQLNDHDCITARSRTGGELIWVRAEQGDGFASAMGGNGPRATPALGMLATSGTERLVLYAIGPHGELNCLDATNGQPVWTVNVANVFPGENLVHAVCGSPLLAGDLIVVCPPAQNGPCLAAFHVSNGLLAWKCDANWRSAYASPALLNINGQDQIVVHAGPGVIAVEPLDGSTIWKYEWTNEYDNNATQPLLLPDSPGDLVIATGYRGGAARVSLVDDAEGLQPVEVWSTRSTMKTKFCNMSQFGDVLVGLDNGIMCAIDAATGKRLWKKGRYGHGQLLQVGNHLLVIAEKGRLYLLKPDSQGHNEIASVDALDRKTWNHPVLIDDQLIVRNDQEIVCFQIALTE